MPGKVKYEGRMDPECVRICDAINALPGLTTIDSCCGHGLREFSVYLMADKVEHLAPLLYYTDS